MAATKQYCRKPGEEGQPKAWGLVLSLKITEATNSVGRRLVQA